MNDHLMLFKENLKSRISRHPLVTRRHPAIGLAQKIANKVGAGRIWKIIDGNPKSYVILTDNRIIRVPLDGLTEARYRKNMLILKKLAKTGIGNFVPRFKERGEVEGYVYFCEERLPGSALDIPLKKMEGMVKMAAEFITAFHQETARKITLNENNYKKSFSPYFNYLSRHLSKEYRKKLGEIDRQTKKQILGKPFVSVWQHGDYKIENVLFDTSNWQIKGVIDWDMANEKGLPMLDVFYLMGYKASLLSRERITDIFKERFIKLKFQPQEKEIIKKYLQALKLSDEFIKPLLIMFWMHHIVERYQQKIIAEMLKPSGWMEENVHNVIELMEG